VDPVVVVLIVAGLLVGATGTWSPCGFSMIETIGPTGHEGGLATTFAASATFAPFAVLGGAITFGVCAWVGELVGAGSTVAYAIAAVVALAAAVAEARGTPIVPQVRRQLPVGWRSTMPMPVAAAGYGVLLGLGFTTFVLSYGVWALMGIVLAVGDPLAGLAAGVAFGIGRAVPIVVLAPLADRPSGERACEAMAMRPALLRGARFGDAMALAALAAVLTGTAVAQASKNEVSGSDPSAAGPALAYETNAGGAQLRLESGDTVPLPGHDPAIGGRWAATLDAGAVVVLDRETQAETGRIAAAGADAVAISDRWLAVRTRNGARDRIAVTKVGEGGAPLGSLDTVGAAKRPAQLSRPALDGNTLVLTVNKTGRNSLVQVILRDSGKVKRRTLVNTKDAGLTAPSVAGKSIAYVRTTPNGQALMMKGGGKGKGRVVYRRGEGPPTLWNTAIAGDRVYATILKRGGKAKIISVGR
jgi:hypothetical protein